MVPFYAGLILLCASADPEKISVKTFNKFTLYFDIDEAIKMRPLINKIIDNPNTEVSTRYFFSMAKKDLDKFESLDLSSETNVRNNLRNFPKLFKINNKKTFSKDELKELNNSRELLAKVFGKHSLIDLFCSNYILTIEKCFNPETNHEKEIINEIKSFSESPWENTPFIDTFYILLCENYLELKLYNLAYEASQSLKTIKQNFSKSDYDYPKIIQLVYEFEALYGLKKFNQIITEYNKLPPNIFDTDNDENHHSAVSIFKILGSSFYETGDLFMACKYQELVLFKKQTLYKDQSKDSVKKEAIILQTYLAKKGDWAAVRTLEERYELKPLPKDAKEK